nr:MAG TPA: zinc finger domain protein [Crassvirales sp.]
MIWPWFSRLWKSIMDRDTVLTILSTSSNKEQAIMGYCVSCGKPTLLSYQFVRLLRVADMVDYALRIVCSLYDIDILQDSEGNVIKYL